MVNEMEQRSRIIDFSFLGISFIIGVIIFTTAWKSNQSSNQTITVTGSAKKEIISDYGILRGTISVTYSSPELAFKELESQRRTLLKFFDKNGFPKDNVELYTITSYPLYEITSSGVSTGRITGYVYNQRIQISSKDVNKIKQMSLDVSSIIEQGVNFSVEPPEYHYTKLADLKIEIQAEAAKDAMVRAKKIAEATDRELGPMRSARMGVIQITPKFSNEVSDYGINDLSSIEKEIIGVVTASFQIE
jgi:hypothetical protein